MVNRAFGAGEVVNHLTILGETKVINYDFCYRVQCRCGRITFVRSKRLRQRKSGCGDINCPFSLFRGLSRTSEYGIWTGMKQRCNNPKNTNFKYYGGRGIQVCDYWQHSFLNFFDDMGSRPSKEYSLDRIDVNGNYEPENCRWATRKQVQN